MERPAVFIDPQPSRRETAEAGCGPWHLATGAGGANAFLNGITEFDPGASLPLHHHNSQKAVVVPERLARCQVEERSRDLGPNEAVVIDAGPVHRLANAGGQLRILFTYGSTFPARTLMATGVTQPVED